MRMHYHEVPTSILSAVDIVVFDIDGVAIRQGFIAKASTNAYISRILSRIPEFKKIIIEAFQLWELLLHIRYDLYEFDLLINRVLECGVSNMGIITDRSLFGVTTVFRNKNYLLQLMDFVQAREGFLVKQESIKGVNIWTTKNAKPHEQVFWKLAKFAKSKNIPSHKVLVMEDDPEVRFMLKSYFGFLTYPDDTVNIEVGGYPLFKQRSIAPV